jgi:bifunctional ADP-heptose synthase (sugar kinase/adenylyltransferase)
VLAVNPDAAVRDGRQAVQLAERALRVSGASDPAVLDILAAAYAEGARFPEAVKLARQAVALSAQSRQASLAARAALYESGQPYRDRHLP